MAQSPFKLFEPYSSNDKDKFFGRDSEIYALYNLLQQTRLVLIYGASGTGKTSLIHAGLPKVFNATDWYRVSVRRKDNINQTLRQELGRLTEQTNVANLAEAIKDLHESRWIPTYLVFDQFEEVFTLGNHEERVKFFTDLQTLLEKPLPCKIILSMREEYIGHLYEYEPLLSTLLDKRFRVEPMKDATVKAVIQQMAASGCVALERDEDTAEQILQQVKEGKQAAHLPYLQVYLHYLYEEATKNNLQTTTFNPIFTEGVIQKVGKLGNVLKTFIQTNLQRAQNYFADLGLSNDFAERLLDEFATDEGTKQSRKATELSQILNTDGVQIANALEYFSEGKLLRADEDDVERYEPVHDVVAKQIHELRSVEDKEYKAFLRQLQLAYVAWVRDGKPTQRLLNDLDLSKVAVYDTRLQPLPNYESELSDFIEKSQAQVRFLLKKERRRLNILIGITVAALVGLGIAVWQYFEADKAKSQVIQALKRAEKAKNEAFISDSLAKLSRDTALLQKSIADAQTLKADSAARQATLQKIVALRAEGNTAKALISLQLTSAQAVDLLISEIDRNILKLEYDSTFKKLETAVNLKSNSVEVKKRVLEVAFWYTEAYNAEAAVSVLKLLNLSSLSNRNDLLSVIQQNTSSQYFAVLQERYFPKMINVEGGDFNMGDNAYEDEQPIHQMTVEALKMAQTETTFWQYNLYCKATGRDLKKQKIRTEFKGDHAIDFVNWYDAVSYCNWLSEHLGIQKAYQIDSLTNVTDKNLDDSEKISVILSKNNLGFRLPTEAEWEFVARGGIQKLAYKFSGSNNPLMVGWFKESFGILEADAVKSVRKLAPNTLNIYDMSGNCLEWCWDNFENYDKKMVQNIVGKTRVLRGGSWSTEAEDGRNTARQYNKPNVRQMDYGFRVVQLQ